jgi:hypothetical protein
VALNGDRADAAHGVFVHTGYCCTKDSPIRTELKVVAMQNYSSRSGDSGSGSTGV